MKMYEKLESIWNQSGGDCVSGEEMTFFPPNISLQKEE